MAITSFMNYPLMNPWYYLLFSIALEQPKHSLEIHNIYMSFTWSTSRQSQGGLTNRQRLDCTTLGICLSQRNKTQIWKFPSPWNQRKVRTFPCLVSFSIYVAFKQGGIGKKPAISSSSESDQTQKILSESDSKTDPDL